MNNGNKKQSEVISSGQGYRANAKSLLEQQIERTNKKSDSLKTLLHRIPWDKLTPEEEQNLWSYFVTKS